MLNFKFSSRTSITVLKNHLSFNHGIVIPDAEKVGIVPKDHQATIKSHFKSISSTQSSQELVEETIDLETESKPQLSSQTTLKTKMLQNHIYVSADFVTDPFNITKKGCLQQFLIRCNFVSNSMHFTKNEIIEAIDKENLLINSKIKENIESYDTAASITMIDFIHDDYEHVFLLFLNFVDTKWKYQHYFLSMAYYDTNLDHQLPVEWIKTTLTDFGIINKPMKFISKTDVSIRRTMTSSQCIGTFFAKTIQNHCYDAVISIFEKIVDVYNTLYFCESQTNKHLDNYDTNISEY